MNKVAFHTLGCKVNQYETEAISEQFIQQGYEVVPFEEVADIYIINTCTVTNIADKKSRKMLSKAKKTNENAVVVAVGCYVQVAYNYLSELPYIDILIGNTHKNDVVKITEEYMQTKEKHTFIEDVHHNIVYEEIEIHTQLDRKRATIKIQDGCDQYCSYCIIPYTRGAVRSRHEMSVLTEVKELVSKGFFEIVLTGIHLGSYGKDLLDGSTLIGLIEKLNKIKGLKRIRLGSLEPNVMSVDFLERLALCELVCPHFHLSLQSGSDSVLQRMKRHYVTEEYYRTVQLLRKMYVMPSITTDVIVGFPMETEQEHEETKAFIRKVQFSDLHVFKYSIRKGTAAARMKPQINGSIKHDRSQQLVQIGELMNKSYLNGFIHKKDRVLIEGEVCFDKINYWVGHTSRYTKIFVESIKFDKSEILLNKEIEVIVEGLFQDGLLGKPALEE